MGLFTRKVSVQQWVVHSNAEMKIFLFTISWWNESSDNMKGDKIKISKMTNTETFDTSKLTDNEKEILSSFYEWRKKFDRYLKQQNIQLYACPGCGYPTLSERGGYEICTVCNWEGDGQDEKQANQVWGGPNQGFTLTETRLKIGKNFKVVADSLNGKINDNPMEVMKAFEKHSIRMSSFDEDKMMDALRGDPIWKEWENASKEIMTDLIKK